MESVASRPFGTLSGCLYAAHGAYLIIAGLFLALFSWLIPQLLIKVVTSEVVDARDLPDVARGVLEHRALMPLLALPVVVFGLLLVNKVPSRSVWLVMGLLSTLLPAGLLIYTFVVTIAILYRGPAL